MQHAMNRRFGWKLAMAVALLVLGGCGNQITEVTSDLYTLSDGAEGETLATADAANTASCNFVRYDHEGFRYPVDSYHGYVYVNPVKKTGSGQVVDFEWGGVNHVRDDLVRHSCEDNPYVLLELFSPLDAYVLEAYIGHLPALVLRPVTGSVPKNGISLRLVTDHGGGPIILNVVEVTIEERTAPEICRYDVEGPSEEVEDATGDEVTVAPAPAGCGLGVNR